MQFIIYYHLNSTEEKIQKHFKAEIKDMNIYC